MNMKFSMDRYKSTFSFLVLSATLALPSAPFAADLDYSISDEILKSKLISKNFKSNSEGVAIIRNNPERLTTLIDTTVTSITSRPECDYQLSNSLSDLHELNEYLSELNTTLLFRVHKKYLLLSEKWNALSNPDCTLAINTVNSLLTNNQKKYSLFSNHIMRDISESDYLTMVKEAEDNALKEKKAKKDAELEQAEIKRLERVRLANSKSTSIAKEMFSLSLCNAYGALFRGRASRSLSEFGEASNIQEAIEKELKRRKIKATSKTPQSFTYEIGSTTCQVYAALGPPDHINTSEGSWGIHEQLVYTHTFVKYIYIENGIVRSLQY